MSCKAQIPGNEEDRRSFFRLDDMAHLSYRVINAEDLPASLEALERSVADSFSVMPNLNALSQQMAACLHKIEQRDPDVATYLKSIDQKIEMLGRALLAKDTGLAATPARPVNLSAGGLALRSEEALEEGTILEVKMLLLPSFTGILTYGSVVACEPEDDDPEYDYCLRIGFTHMRDVDRDALIRHLLRRQADLLRKRRETSS